VSRCRVEVHPDRVDISLCRHRLAKKLAGRPIDLTHQNQTLDHSSDDALTLTTPASLKRVGREMRMLVNGSDDQAAADPSLLRIIVRAHDIQGRLSQNTSLTVHDIAREEGVTAVIGLEGPHALVHSLGVRPPLPPATLHRHRRKLMQFPINQQSHAGSLLRECEAVLLPSAFQCRKAFFET